METKKCPECGKIPEQKQATIGFYFQCVCGLESDQAISPFGALSCWNDLVEEIENKNYNNNNI